MEVAGQDDGVAGAAVHEGIQHLAPRARYADLGIGDGMLTLMLAEVALSVTAIDGPSCKPSLNTTARPPERIARS